MKRAIFTILIFLLQSISCMNAWAYCNPSDSAAVSSCAANTTTSKTFKCCTLKIIGVCTQVNTNFKINGKANDGKDATYEFKKSTTLNDCPIL